MPHWFVHSAVIVFRVVAGVVGVAAFYLALFLYDDEEGRLHNRLEQLWISVHDRARATSNKSTALVNSIGGILTTVFNRLFGGRLLSFRAVVMSYNMSFLGATLYGAFKIWASGDSALLNLLLGLLIMCFIIPMMISSKRWVLLFCSLLLLTFFGNAVLVFSTLLPANEIEMNVRDEMILTIASTLSIVSDFVIVLIIRKAVRALKHSYSIPIVSLIITALVAAGAALFFIQYLIFKYTDADDLGGSTRYVVNSLSNSLFRDNVLPALMAFLPALALALVILHRSMWPLTARLVYQLPRSKVLANKKLLFSIGTACLGLALNVEEFILGPISKLLHHG
jgi:hypothetical protein